MGSDRVFTSEQFRNVLDQLKTNNVRSLELVDNKDIFMFAVSMGLNNPQQLKNKKGLFLNTALKTADKALLESVLLGKVQNDSEIDEFADFEKSLELCEQCAEAGYQVPQKKYNDAGCDNELFERRLLKELELLYKKNVECDI